MDKAPDVLTGRLEQIAYPHIRARLQALRNNPSAMLDYVNHLFLDTRDGQRRGFDFTTASTLMDIKYDLMKYLGEIERLHDGVVGDQDFKAAPSGPIADYQPVKLPKNW